METIYLNGKFIPKGEAMISPDDRGFLFADGIYEVVRWYTKNFFDMPGHMSRLKRSLDAVRIDWPEADSFPEIAGTLITVNGLEASPSMVYLQVTRGAARRTHNFPAVHIPPTVYSYAWGFTPDMVSAKQGISVSLKEDIRWSRCDIKSIALLPNILSFQDAFSQGYKECAFVRDGYITECSHSNIFFINDGILYTHPESRFILSGISRKNVIKTALENGIPVREEPYPAQKALTADEAFISNTSAEITPVVEIDGTKIGSGHPGEITKLLMASFAWGRITI